MGCKNVRPRFYPNNREDKNELKTDVKWLRLYKKVLLAISKSISHYITAEYEATQNVLEIFKMCTGLQPNQT